MPNQAQPTERRGARMGIILIGLAALLAFLILNGHGDHLLSLVPLLVLFAYPLTHMFMHHGHGHRRESGVPHSLRSDGRGGR